MFAVKTESVKCALESCDMAVVVRAPDVYRPVKAALFKLVAVIRYIGGKVGVKAVGAAQNVILQVKLVYILLCFSRFQKILGENFGGSEPQCAVHFIGIAALGQFFYGIDNIAAVMER